MEPTTVARAPKTDRQAPIYFFLVFFGGGTRKQVFAIGSHEDYVNFYGLHVGMSIIISGAARAHEKPVGSILGHMFLSALCHW